MTLPNDDLLVEVFCGLREAGLPLEIEDYHLFFQALEEGFYPENYKELRLLCQRLWVKSLKERKLFEEWFDKLCEKYSEEYFQEFLKRQVLNTQQPETTTPSSAVRNPLSSRNRVSSPLEATPPQQREPEETPDSTEEMLVVQAVPLQQDKKQIPDRRFTLTEEYFPVTRRQMQQGWRKLRQPMREGVSVDFDVPATVKRVSQQGFFLEPVPKYERVNQTELLLLLDQSHSMMPFAPLAEQLIATAQQDGRLGQTKIYYFRNAMGNLRTRETRFLEETGFLEPQLEPQQHYLYSDPDLLQKQPLDDIIPHLHKNHTVVLIFSDAGSARGGFNVRRIELTDKFLFDIKPVVRQVVWLNPLPVSRWDGTTAGEIAKFVSMYPFGDAGWRRMMYELRGGLLFLRSKMIYVNEPRSRSVPQGRRVRGASRREERVREASRREERGKEEFVEKVKECLDWVQPVHTFSVDEEFSRYEAAANYIVDFAMFGQAYLDFACHAAFPLALTPDLLYYLRENFPLLNREGEWLDVDWLAIPDLLLSNLCRSAGYQLYEMDSAVRHLLLKLLRKDERFGSHRFQQLSQGLLFYLQQKLENTKDIQDFGENPQWIALAYTEPSELARQLAAKLQQTYSGDRLEKVKSTSLIATFAEPLAEANFQPLLTFARGWERLARGYKESSQEIFDEFPKKTREINVAGVKLWIPGRKLPQFSFNVVTLNARGEIVKQERHQAKYFKEDLGNGVTLDMVAIPGGTFLMGSPKSEAGSYDDERPQHEVTVPPFFMGKYPVTQKQWRAVANLPQVNRELDPNPSYFKGVSRPVENILWYEAVEFCDRLSEYTGKKYRLPSEAEWEYACRADTTTHFHFGETITTEVANYDGDYTYASASKGQNRGRTTPVGSFKVANAFGLFDM
ncbi:MAG: SUMF1/EgtB/PvdO family nonheme iron enzyme, partial [Scytonema sp. PMC 1069.18]|nr:SUMF1/EgtB/PvdO family nonheme iron enzyme [Scytonema sp. PMC 1069.18]